MRLLGPFKKGNVLNSFHPSSYTTHILNIYISASSIIIIYAIILNILFAFHCISYNYSPKLFHSQKCCPYFTKYSVHEFQEMSKVFPIISFRFLKRFLYTEVYANYTPHHRCGTGFYGFVNFIVTHTTRGDIPIGYYTDRLYLLLIPETFHVSPIIPYTPIVA